MKGANERTNKQKKKKVKLVFQNYSIKKEREREPKKRKSCVLCKMKLLCCWMQSLLPSKGVLAAVGDVEEAVLVLEAGVDLAHG